MNELKLKIKIIESKLKSKEWIPLKVFLGEWSSDDPRYIEYLAERKRLRSQHKALLDELENESKQPS